MNTTQIDYDTIAYNALYDDNTELLLSCLPYLGVVTLLDIRGYAPFETINGVYLKDAILVEFAKKATLKNLALLHSFIDDYLSWSMDDDRKKAVLPPLVEAYKRIVLQVCE